MNRTNGRIAEESKKKFAGALLELMKVYQYGEITVTQLSQEAELSRKTFYRLFDDKDDILTLLFDGLYYECFAQIRQQNVKRYWDLVQLYFDFWESRRKSSFCSAKTACCPGCLTTFTVMGKAFSSLCAPRKPQRNTPSPCPIFWPTASAVCTVCSSSGWNRG